MPKINDVTWKFKEERDTLTCKDCGNSYDKSMFQLRGKTTSGSQKYDPRCRPCAKAFALKNFGSVRRAHEHRQRLQDIISVAKTKCVVCGYDKFKGALDFHHVDASTKEAEIADMVNLRNVAKTTPEQLSKEIEKCVVLCSNCHREVHGGVIDL